MCVKLNINMHKANIEEWHAGGGGGGGKNIYGMQKYTKIRILWQIRVFCER